MPRYYRSDDLYAFTGGLTFPEARESLRQTTWDASATYDIFLSHSIHNSLAILGLRNLLVAQGLSVYVDWIDDPELNRSQVSAATAQRIRVRMRNSRSLIYATSRAASSSRWMPWELGYFDGLKGQQMVSICPIESASAEGFVGQEYLGLYKVIKRVEVTDGRFEPYAVFTSGDKGQSVRFFAAGSPQYDRLSRN